MTQPDDPPAARAAASPRFASLLSGERRALTVGLVLTVTLVAFETLAISTVMPLVIDELGDIELYGWVFSAFFLGSLLGTVVLGRSVDRFGLVAPFVVGLVLFAIGLLAGGLAPSMPILVAARFLQGLGAGAISPIAYVAIGRSLPHSLRAAMFAVLALAWVLPALVGPALAGLIGEHVGWRVVFLGLLPLIALAGVLTFSALARIPGAADPPADELSADEPSADRPRSDRGAAQLRDAVLVVAGAGLATAGLTSVSLVPGVPLVAIGVLLTVPAFGRLTPAGTLRGAPGLPAAVLLRGVMTFAFFCADAYVPLALQDWRGTSPSVAGIALTAASLAWSAGAWVQARRVTRWGPRVFVAAGLICVALGTVGFAAVLIPTVPIALGIAAWAVAGLGMGLSYSMLSLVTLAEATPGEEGAATSGLQLSDLLGTSLGTGVGGALIAAGLASGLEIWTGLAGAFGVGAATALGALVLAGRMPGRAAWRAHSLRTATPHA